MKITATLDTKPHPDANGNIAAVTSPFRALAAKFSYDAFGRTTSQSVPKSGIDIHALNYRFSTKPMELELATSNTTLVPPPLSSGLYYYGYRFYSPNLGRWISRDPIREQGGRNLYNFVGNDGVDKWDLFGFSTAKQIYCDAASRHPDNQWLQCACQVSTEINALILSIGLAGPFTENPDQAGKILNWFTCVRSCMVEKFKEFESSYEGEIESDKMTPEWKDACKKCKDKTGISTKKDCCVSMVKAEQSGLEGCKSKCGQFPGNGSKMPIPGFEGNFNKLDDRIKFGLKKCCEK